MWLLLIVSILIGQSSSEFKSFLDPEYDFFKDFLIKYRNMDEDPCNDFFRHVCPRSFPEQESSTFLSKWETSAWYHPALNYVQSQLVNASGTPPLYKVPFYYEGFMAMVANAYTEEVDEIVRDFVSFSWIPFRASMILSTRGNPNHPLSTFNFTRYTRMYSEMNQLLAEELNYPGNANYSDQAKELWGENYKRQTFLVGLMNETADDAHFYMRTYVEYMERYHKYLSDFDRPPFTPADWYDRLEELLSLYNGYLKDIVERIPKKFRMLLHETGVHNAFNADQGNLFFMEQLMLPVLRNDILEEIFLSVAGSVTGHEMFHSYVNGAMMRTENGRTEFFDDTMFDEKLPCQIEHYESVCLLWREGECLSGGVTWSEDGPDLEGYQLSYKLLKKRLAGKMKDIAYQDLNITREQLYFYANTVVWCNSYSKTQHFLRQHSGNMHRINGALSLLKGFQSAFNCKKDDKMVQRSRCNYFGSEIRR